MPLPAASSTRRYDAHRHRWHEVQREHAECLRRHPRARPRSTADSSRAPSRTCDPEIIRAAWSTDILGRLGAQLRKPRGDPSTYALSHATMQIDGFVSQLAALGLPQVPRALLLLLQRACHLRRLGGYADGRWSPSAAWTAMPLAAFPSICADDPPRLKGVELLPQACAMIISMAGGGDGRKPALFCTHVGSW